MSRNESNQRKPGATKAALQAIDKPALVSLIAELYKRSPENRRLVDARLHPRSTVHDARQAVAALMDPSDAARPLVAEARRVISDFKKGNSQPADVVDLMIHFVERGNAFTLRYGDIDAEFYESLIRMYGSAAERVHNLPEMVREPFAKRLSKLVELTQGLGWGYHDALFDAFQDLFPTEDA